MTTDTKRPEDIFEQIHHEGSSKNLPARIKQPLTQSSVKVDEGVKDFGEKVIRWQELINYFRVIITQNELIIITFCFLFGTLFSYAINECTGDLNLSTSVYVLSAIVVLSFSLLMIADEALPLIILIKFIISAWLGHYGMMWIIALDGHTWQLFTSDVCKYPISADLIFVFIVGSGVGYAGKTFEEIRAASKEI